MQLALMASDVGRDLLWRDSTAANHGAVRRCAGVRDAWQGANHGDVRRFGWRDLAVLWA